MDQNDTLYIRKSIAWIVGVLAAETCIFFGFVGYEDVNDLISKRNKYI